MKIKIYISDIIALLFFHISFITLPYFKYYNFLKYGIVLIIAIYLFCNYNILFEKKYMAVNITLFLFMLVVLITSFINKDNLEGRNVFLASIVFCLILLEAFLLFQCFEYKNKVNRIIGLIFGITVFYVVLTDVFLFLNSKLVEETEGYYLIGNKFSVVYAHLLMICLCWRIKLRTRKIILGLMYVLTIFVSLIIGSATGIIGTVVCFLFMISYKRIKPVIMKPIMPVLFLLLACIFFLIFEFTDSSLMRFLVEDVLHRDVTLTGRMDIYGKVFALIPNHLWSGYGHGSTFEICMKLLGAPNTQNGLLELLVQYGVIGVTLFLLLLLCVFRRNSHLKNRECSKPIVAILYIYIFLASVEITLGLEFFSFLAILTVCSEIDNQSNMKGTI